jgi:GNAT superfamily N-acetyltransferase
MATRINHTDIESKLRDHVLSHGKKFGTLIHNVRFTNNVPLHEVIECANDAYLEDKIGKDGFKVCDRTNEEEIKYKTTTHEHDGGFVLIRDADGLLHSMFFVIVEQRDDGKYLTLHMLSVLRKLQGCGLGGMMLDLVDQIAKFTGCEKLELYAVNVAKLQIEMYKRRGYAPVGTAEWPTHLLCNLKPEKRFFSEIHFLVMQKLLHK